MKSLLHIIACSFILISMADAAVLTVSNNPAIPAQYNSAQAAYNAAANGDILYLHGSPSEYYIEFSNKRVRVIGPGFYPTGQNNLRANFRFVIYPETESACDNIQLEGLSFNSPSYIYSGPPNNPYGGNYSVNGLDMIRCVYGGSFIAYGSGSHSIQFTQSLLLNQYIFGPLPGGVTAINCIIVGHPGFNSAYFKNCTFYLANDAAYYNVGSCPINSCVVENSIFKLTNANYPQGYSISPTNTVFTHCVFDGSQAAIGGSSNAFSNCLFQTNPGFIDDASSFFLYNFNDATTFINDTDLRLAPGSAALTAGSGGTAAGITGGDFAFTNPKTQGRTTLPQMNTLTISSTAVPQNGAINVTFEAEKQD